MDERMCVRERTDRWMTLVMQPKCRDAVTDQVLKTKTRLSFLMNGNSSGLFIRSVELNKT